LDEQTVTFESVEELILAARNGRSQKEFADLLEVDQSMVSKYERGKASPPIGVINRCMRLVHAAEDEAAPSAEQLADRVRESLADPKLGQVRAALSRLVDAFAFENAQARSSGAAPQ
jgi:transcriptional regulator with XRE-family HTH domain